MIKMIFKSHLFIVAFLLLNDVFGQTIEGKVRDVISGEVLIGANVSITSGENGAVTDQQGVFRISGVSPGLHQIQVSYIGYFTFVEKEVWVKAGKVTFVEVNMHENASELEAVEISASPMEIQSVAAFGITEEKINRYAASYNDPARLVTAISDVAVANDQNNQISVRGISPIYNVWRLEGVEIVNPNHLANAGTFNDQPASTGGGVNILSAQMLGKSEFKYGAMDNSASNVVGGLFDMSLRNGYAGGYQFTSQASFIGFDLSAEGPIVKDKPASFLVNYRYSFTGLLGAMGVDFGGEKIGFQDLSFNVNTPFKNGGSLKIFGMFGSSHNHFQAKAFADSKIQKDRSDIYYDAAMGAMGVKYNKPIGNGRARLSFSSVFSALDNSRDETTYLANDWVSIPNLNLNFSRIFSNRLELYRPIGMQHSITFGICGNGYNDSPPRVLEYQKLLFSPYANVYLSFNQHFQINSGFTIYQAYDRDESIKSLDFRILSSYTFTKTKISAGAGQYSQLIVPGQAFINGFSNWVPSDQLAMMKSQRYMLSIQQKMEGIALEIEGFYYIFPDVLYGRTQPKYFINQYDASIETPDNAKSVGATLSLSKELTKDYYYRFGATIFNSTYKNTANETFDNPYNAQQSYHFIAGKKLELSNDQKKRELSLNLKGIAQGGLFQETGHYFQGRTFFSENDNNIFYGGKRLNPYARLDFRIQWIRYRPNTTSSWSLDVQNVTNRQNEAYEYYDSFTGNVEMNYQLGMIPILTYRIEF
jgi:hypothetical protein